MTALGTRESSVGRRVLARRRRRGFGALLALAIVVVAAILVVPKLRHEYKQLTLPLHYTAIINQQARAKKLDPALVAAVIYAETRFRARTSSTGAEGLMQIEPATAEFLAKRSGGTTFKVADLSEPAVNIAYGTYYLRYLLDEFDGNVVPALAAYNGGETAVSRWVAAAQGGASAFTAAQIPDAQVRAYVTEILDAQKRYRAKWGADLDAAP